MIRRGRAEGWLRMPSSAFRTWASFNDVNFQHVKPGTVLHGGGALLAQDKIAGHATSDDMLPLLTVPKDLILGVESVWNQAKADADFREVLTSLGEFGRDARGAVLTFLLFQATMSEPQVTIPFGVHGSFTDYVKSLPMENLPTFWNKEELDLLEGTSLLPAITAKMKSLNREFEMFLSRVAESKWYDSVREYINFDDWLQVDAMYRSRALDFPGVGHCMVPCIDLANHAAGAHTSAIYEVNDDGDATLLLRPGKELTTDEEVTITYGDDKGACEMIFSYGFLEQDRTSAQAIFLGLTIPEDDPYRVAKREIARCAPGIKLVSEADGRISWTGDFIWLLCVNHEDGLRFRVARGVDGQDDTMEGFFNDCPLTYGAEQLHQLLQASALWDVFQLRAVTLLEECIFAQSSRLVESQDMFDAAAEQVGDEAKIRTSVYTQIKQLRQLEFDMLEAALEHFGEQQLDLIESDVVKQYLSAEFADLEDEYQET